MAAVGIKAVRVGVGAGSLPRFCQQPLLQQACILRQPGFIVCGAFPGQGPAALRTVLQVVQGIAVILQLRQPAFRQFPQLLPAHVGIAAPGFGILREFVRAFSDDGEDDGAPIAPEQGQDVFIAAAAAIVKAEDDGLFRQGTAVVDIVDEARHADGGVARLLQPAQITFQLLRVDAVLPGVAAAHLVIHENGQQNAFLLRARCMGRQGQQQGQQSGQNVQFFHAFPPRTSGQCPKSGAAPPSHECAEAAGAYSRKALSV